MLKQLTLFAVVQSGQHLNASKIFSIFSLSATLKRVRSTAPEKKWIH